MEQITTIEELCQRVTGIEKKVEALDLKMQFSLNEYGVSLVIYKMSAGLENVYENRHYVAIDLAKRNPSRLAQLTSDLINETEEFLDKYTGSSIAQLEKNVQEQKRILAVYKSKLAKAKKMEVKNEKG